MIFRLNPASGHPLYLQLMEQVRHAVETGVLQDGDLMPSIRALAEELVISHNTVAKAYMELQHEGDPAAKLAPSSWSMRRLESTA
jgi:GntR family transcriptional regulator